MFDGGDGVLGVIGSIPPPPNTASWVDAKELDFGLIWPQHFTQFFCMTTAGTGELRFIEGNMDSNMYCDILKQKMMPSLQKLFSNITTPNTPPRWQLPCCWKWRWRWWSGQVCLQTWTLLSTCGASSSWRWRSTMCLTSSSSVMSLWRSGRGCQQQTVQLWWIPCPGGLRQC